MIPRAITNVLIRRAEQFPVVSLTGPRQSGKTTLTRAAFPDHHYANLEDPSLREYARTDPREFLAQYPDGMIIDEAQRVPDLFSYIQLIVDEQDRPGRFILTGSHNFLLLRSVQQSLAGRVAVLHLLPLSLAEIDGREPLELAAIGRDLPRQPVTGDRDLANTLFTGGFPRLFARDLPAQVWLGSYVRTYVERDVQDVLRVSDLEAFGRFLGLCAGRNGQLVNLSSLAADCGVTHPTVRSWLSVLETSFLITLLRPHHANFNKRLIKSPKLYFLDTGLLCYLLKIRSPDELRTHAMRGAIFESFVLSELTKNCLNRGHDPDLYFWRDSTGHEVDLVIDRGRELIPIEAKSGTTLPADALDGLRYWLKLAGRQDGPSALIHGGNECSRRQGTVVYPWSVL